ncbi:MAG TPA: HD-GYP domain-containing protein [Vicinamibacterales bacterium]|jgi:putative nucleotidyltransferase with HDIG domain|nr:HD-GYP domain-containing protein [Vicinamibacterales bacterium]
MTGADRAVLAEEVVRRLAAALRGAQLYAPGHPLVARGVGALAETLTLTLANVPSVTIGIVGDDLVVADYPIPRAAETMGELMRRLRQAGIERIVIQRGVDIDEIERLVASVASGETDKDGALGKLPHVRVGRIEVEERIEGVGDMATFQRLYSDASNVAGVLWDSAAVEGKPDADAARNLVDSLAQAVAQNRTALLALTALKNYDNYTFTHMVNVSILTMGQARGLGIEGGLLREFGLAALMHDIGKVKTPNEVLNKPGKLSDEEFDILKRHTVDGAEILKNTPEIPALGPIVAFEHHLRSDGTGYPVGTVRPQLNLATTLCGIADVYDAMRSQRVYQAAHPTDRILAVLQRNDGKQFDQRLVKRFVQLVGIYPAGNLVRLDTGEIAVVLKAYAPDPYRPRVKVLTRPNGQKLEHPYDVSLWDTHEGQPQAIQAPVDVGDLGIDPLSYL